MNKKGFLEDINPIYFVLAVASGIIAYFISDYAGAETWVKIAALILSPVVLMIWFVLTGAD